LNARLEPGVALKVRSKKRPAAFADGAVMSWGRRSGRA